MEQPKQEKRRKRKKRLLSAIRDQIEFYFSDANLRHDPFMRQLISADDPQLMGQNAVDLDQFLKFNKISQMTQKVGDICLALESSDYLCLDKNELKVKRKEPFVNKDKNFADESTIYVERLPPNTDHNWIRLNFESFGSIEYIKIPKFKHNQNIMGFAFIEFSQPEEAQKAVKHYNRFSSANSKNGDNTHETIAENTLETNNENVSSGSRKRALEVNDKIVVESKKSKLSDENSISDKEIVTDTNDTETPNTSKSIKKKKKRKRKRKSMIPEAAEEEPEVLHLRVMSKDEWKRWKKDYLKLQKQTMSSIKRSLLPENEAKSDHKTQSKEVCDKSFESGLIIKLNFTVASSDLNEQQFKRNIRNIGDKHDIQYIDLPLNRMQFKDNQTVDGVCYIRTNKREDSNRLVSHEKLKQLGQLVVLEGNEEKEYWNQIFEQRNKAKSKSDECNNKSRNRIRGFDKIINRVENVRTSVDTKPNKYIKFD